MDGIGEVAAGLYVFVVIFVLALLVNTVYKDMKQRGRTAWAYVLLLVVLPPIGLLAWLVDRRRFPVLVSR